MSEVTPPGTVILRPVTDDDLDAIFEQMRDPAAVSMAAFTARDPNDRGAFDAHMTRLRSSPDIHLRVIETDGLLVGTAASYVMDGDTEVTYWVDRAHWGRGIASRALTLLLVEVPIRPIKGRAASDNLGSLAVLRKTGFTEVERETSFAEGRGEEVEEVTLWLE